ncbi:hypothetical protein, partial [Streptomyces gardneri]|uniref:hypothetical protein n=1 Tax=Streptomyces gardneri TaxID=66892 RepID=UPI0036903DF7
AEDVLGGPDGLVILQGGIGSGRTALLTATSRLLPALHSLRARAVCGWPALLDDDHPPATSAVIRELTRRADLLPRLPSCSSSRPSRRRTPAVSAR